jgi:hypothetical protein
MLLSWQLISLQTRLKLFDIYVDIEIHSDSVSCFRETFVNL